MPSSCVLSPTHGCESLACPSPGAIPMRMWFYLNWLTCAWSRCGRGTRTPMHRLDSGSGRRTTNEIKTATIWPLEGALPATRRAAMV